MSDGNGDRCLISLEWGFIPEWDEALEFRKKLYNLRVETILESLNGKADSRVREEYLKAAQARRCIIPVRDAVERSKTDGQIYRLVPRSGDMLCIAGLWSQVRQLSGEELGTVGMITTEHESIGRIPLFLENPGGVAAWLQPNPCSVKWLTAFLGQNRYTGQNLFKANGDKAKCAEHSPEQSPQMRLLLP